MKTKESGIILVTTVMLIALLTLMTLSQLQIFLLNSKVYNLERNKQKDFRILENAANKIVRQIDLKGQGSCVVPENLFNIFNNLSKKGCLLTYKNQQFYYLIEDLGVFPCLHSKKGKQLYSTRHYRLSLQSKKTKAILQLRQASLANLEDCPLKQQKDTLTGLISWRYIEQTV
ncbi:MAG: hypothetical protein H0U57_03995 [Tatlockia sp.]|nr:hypothetical protein [Tatlockia sp.]